MLNVKVHEKLRKSRWPHATWSECQSPACDPLLCVFPLNNVFFFLKDKTKYNISAVEWHKAELKDLLPTLVFTDIISGQS